MNYRRMMPLLLAATAIAGCKKETPVQPAPQQTSSGAPSAVAATSTEAVQKNEAFAARHFRLLGGSPPAGMTRVTVSLRFSGISYLMRDTSPPELLMPDMGAHGHTLFVGADLTNVDPSDPFFNVHAPVGATANANSRLHAVPSGIEIQLPAIVDPTLDMDDQGDALNDDCPTALRTPDESLYWVAHVSRAAGAPAAGIKLKAGTRAAAHLTFGNGALFADVAAHAHKIKFTSAQGAHTQALANELVYQFQVDLPTSNQKLTLEAKNAGGATIPLGTYVATGGHIDIKILNADQHDYFNPTFPALLHHLPFYFESFDGLTPPEIADVGTCPTGGVGGDVECGPMQKP